MPVSDPLSFSPVASIHLDLHILSFATPALFLYLPLRQRPPRRAPTRRLDGWEIRTDIVPLLRIRPRVPVVGHLDGRVNDDREPSSLRPMPR